MITVHAAAALLRSLFGVAGQLGGTRPGQGIIAGIALAWALRGPPSSAGDTAAQGSASGA